MLIPGLKVDSVLQRKKSKVLFDTAVFLKNMYVLNRCPSRWQKRRLEGAGPSAVTGSQHLTREMV